MISKRAIWIFDDNFSVLTYLSVRSLTSRFRLAVSLIYCGHDLENVRKPFDNISGDIEWIIYRPDVDHFPSYLRSTIVNRLARMHALEKYNEEITILVDSDIVFSDNISEYLSHLDELVLEENQPSSVIMGVTEFRHAADAYLIFNKKDSRGDAIKLSESEKNRILRKVFGQDYEFLLSQSQFNNGLLIFYKAHRLVNQWKIFYKRMLLHKKINPADDQVPLAAAIKKTGIKSINLHARWNSLGRSSGDYLVYHAWAGNWINELKDIFNGNNDLSDYARECTKYILDCPKDWLESLNDRLQMSPSYYQKIPGYFDFGGMYNDIVDNSETGHFVEVGTYKGKSACYMGELIKAKGKLIQFDTIDHFCRKDTSLHGVQDEFKKAGVSEYINLIPLHSREAVQLYGDNSLDFVFLDIEQNSHEFIVELENWYHKLKEGGILAGYDYSIHDTVNKGYLCYSHEFAKSQQIPLRTYKQRFILTKQKHLAYDTV